MNCRFCKSIVLSILLTVWGLNTSACIIPNCVASDPKLDQVITAINAGGGGGGSIQYTEGATTTPAKGTSALCRYISGGQTLTNAQLWTLACDASNNLLVSVASSVLAANAATASNQATTNTTLSTIATNTGNGSTSALQTTMNTNLTTIATNTGNGSTSANQTNGNQLVKITNGTQVADTVAGDSGQNSLVVVGNRKEISFTTTTVQALATTDVSNYKTFSIHLITSGTGSSVFPQGSNDNINWINVSAGSVNNITSLPTAAGIGGANVLLSGPINFRYLRLNVTGISSGTTAGVLELFSHPSSIIAAIQVKADQSNVWSNGLLPIASPAAANSPNEASVSTGYETSHVVKASAGVLYSLLCYNSKASAQFLLAFNSTTLPADTTTSITVPITCAASSNCTLDFNPYGKYFSTGIVWSNSSTSPTKTIGSADMFCEPRYQ